MMRQQRCEEDGGGALRECRVTFRAISDTLGQVMRAIEELRGDVREVREQGIRLGASQDALRATLREHVQPALAQLAHSAPAAVQAHEQGCAGRRQALAAVSAPAAHPADDPGGAFRIPRWLIYAAIFAGLATAAGGGWFASSISSTPPAATAKP